MSLYAADGFGYLQQVEAYFLSQSRIGVMLSSKDTELMRGYRDAGVPVEVVCLGIKLAFALYEEAPRSLYQCRHLIDKEIKAWRQRAAGSHEPPSGSFEKPALPGRDLPDPTDPERRKRIRRARARRAARPSPRAPTPPTQPPSPPPEPWLEAWSRSMQRLIELGKTSNDEHVTRCYRWAYRQMRALKAEATEHDDKTWVASTLPLAVGEIEAAMYDQLYNSLHPDLRAELEGRLPPHMRRALRAMSGPAQRRQLRVWRRRLLEEMMSVSPFFTP